MWKPNANEWIGWRRGRLSALAGSHQLIPRPLPCIVNSHLFTSSLIAEMCTRGASYERLLQCCFAEYGEHILTFDSYQRIGEQFLNQLLLEVDFIDAAIASREQPRPDLI